MPGIIFEGADASGKSTLARKIAKESGRQLFLAGGAPKDDAEMWRMIDQQASALEAGQIIDRVSPISQQIYREGLWRLPSLALIVDRWIEQGHVLVYCRPPDNILLDPKYHVWKGYDTDDWKQQVLTNQATYVERYDQLMAQVPCIIYDWTSEESTHIEALLAEIDTEGVLQGLHDMMRRKA